MRLFDLGGSGVKTVQVEGSFPVDSLRRARIQYFPRSCPVKCVVSLRAAVGDEACWFLAR